MRRRALFLIAILVVSLLASACAGGPAPRTRVSIGIGTFYDHLAVYGDWLWVDAYGWVWLPWDMPAAWVPYTHGHWVLTGYGWTWVSAWPWGWAPFHYGRWTHHATHGWIWIPGTHWAPAWVAWRQGPGTWGWAPLPPGAHWDLSLGLRWDGLGIDLHAWSFVHEGDFLHLRLEDHLLRGDRRGDLLRDSREAARLEVGPRGAYNPGIPVRDVERVHGVVPRFEVRDLERPPRQPGARVDRTGLRVELYRPSVRREPDSRKPPPSQRTPRTSRGHGHG